MDRGAVTYGNVKLYIDTSHSMREWEAKNIYFLDGVCYFVDRKTNKQMMIKGTIVVVED